MRLINVETLQLEEFMSDPPPYAILSHTWTREEVTFDDLRKRAPGELLSSHGDLNAGWRKIHQTCCLAREDQLHYAWVDTCCINKESSAELSESINSMFRWYQEAACCYTYLEDMVDPDDFWTARWFTRGWTLQELLAPKTVTFFDKQWQYVGTREELAERISARTKIDWEALQGTEPLGYMHNASVAKKMSWAADRITTRAEDMSYCLLGLFGVNMPLLYGEGGSRAFKRLQEEIIKRTSDLSFLAWTQPTTQPNKPDDDARFLADHPRCFEHCRSIMNTGEDIAPYSITNRGLQLRLSVFQIPGRRNRYIALLACFKDDAHRDRVGIRLRAVNLTYTDFEWEESTTQQVVHHDDLQRARVRDICIVRSSARSRRQVLWIRSPQLGIHDWWRETLSIDASGQWQRHVSGKNWIEIPNRENTVPHSYGFFFTNPCPPSALTSRHSEKTLSKFFIRVDIGLRSSYTAHLTIHENSDDIDEKFQNLGMFSTVIDPSVVRSRHVSAVIRANQPERLGATISWSRINDQDVLVLDIAIEDPTLYGRLFRLLPLTEPRPLSIEAFLLFMGLLAATTYLDKYYDTGYFIAAAILSKIYVFWRVVLARGLMFSIPTLWNTFTYSLCFAAVAADTQHPLLTQLIMNLHRLLRSNSVEATFTLFTYPIVLLAARHSSLAAWISVALCSIGGELFWVVFGYFGYSGSRTSYLILFPTQEINRS